MRRRKDLDTGLKEEEEQEQLNPSFVGTTETLQEDRSGQELHFREVGSCKKKIYIYIHIYI